MVGHPLPWWVMSSAQIVQKKNRPTQSDSRIAVSDASLYRSHARRARERSQRLSGGQQGVANQSHIFAQA
jgi:hypothetical protein